MILSLFFRGVPIPGFGCWSICLQLIGAGGGIALISGGLSVGAMGGLVTCSGVSARNAISVAGAL